MGARGEIYAAAYLLHKGHPKSKLWAEKVYEMDSTGRVSFSELLAYEILQLEIATDNGACDLGTGCRYIDANPTEHGCGEVG